MAALSSTMLTLLDLARRTDPDGTGAKVVEVLHQQNEMLEDMVWMQGNLETGHQATIRTGIPAPTWTKIGGGITPAKSTTAPIKFATGKMQALSEVPADLLELASDPAAARFIEERAFIEGMNQELQSTLLYGNSGSEPEAFTGLATHYNSLSAQNADNIIDAGGSSTDNRSIFLVYWSDSTVFGIVPKHVSGGMKVTDYGKGWIEDASNGSNTGRMLAYRTHFEMHAGLVVADWRAAVRVCNIDKSNLNAAISGSSADLADLMFQAMELVPAAARIGRPAFYMDRYTLTMLRRQLAKSTANSTLQYRDVGGIKVAEFHGVPIRRVDAMASDEARVT